MECSCIGLISQELEFGELKFDCTEVGAVDAGLRGLLPLNETVYDDGKLSIVASSGS